MTYRDPDHPSLQRQPRREVVGAIFGAIMVAVAAVVLLVVIGNADVRPHKSLTDWIVAASWTGLAIWVIMGGVRREIRHRR